MRAIFFLFFITNTIFQSYSQEKLHLSYLFEDRFGYENKSELYVIGNESAYEIKESRKNGIFTGPQKINKDLLKNQPENSILKVGEPYPVYSDIIGKIFFANQENEYLRFPSESIKELIYQHHSTKKIDWKISNQRKKIGNYMCIKATCKKNGRFYTVWFSPDIPINKGPVLLNGLPGAIVEASEDDGLFTVKLTDLKSLKNEQDFQRIKKYFQLKKILPYAAYEKFIRKSILMGKMSLANKMPGIKKEFNAKKYGESLQINVNPKFFYERILDIPENIDNDLNKIQIQ